MPRNFRLNSRLLTVFIFLALLVVGCTTYTPRADVVPQEELATYNPKDFGKREKPYNNASKEEDEWIIKAIFYEQNSDYKRSNFYYKKLYETTHKDEYLLKELKTALYSGVTSENISKLKEYVASHPNKLIAKRLLLSAYLYEKKYEEAKRVTSSLLSQSDEAIDFELSANPYIFTKDYARAVQLLTEAYDKSYNENILLKITTILVNYMREIPEAILRLENHRKRNGCSEKICLQLINIYFQQNRIPKIVSLYKHLYQATQKELYAEKVVESYIYLKEYDKAIAFLKTDYSNVELLYSLYIDQKKFDEADKLVRKLIASTGEAKWYAESAMILFESTANKDDKAMLEEVVRRFEIALAKGVKSSVYLNYYAYTLIDKDIDVKKGIKIIKKVLEEQPEKGYYLDSLAWGYYKLGECREALAIMKKVITIEGLKEAEIRKHWNAINQKCKK